MRPDGSKVLWLAARVFVGLVFFYSGLAKILEPRENFVAFLQQYRALPDFTIPWIASFFPWFEYLAGSFLILGYAGRWMALTLGVTSVALMAVIALSGLLWGNGAGSCGCFGKEGLPLTSRQVFLLDTANAFLGIRLFFARPDLLSLDSILRKSPKNIKK
jgi:uncharacterized membrane protein YphA (DoxX/SURF4 family)